MRLTVLGSGAGGGIPQWNAKNSFSRGAEPRGPAVSTRSQTSLAVSADGERWVLLNASPDLRAQILATPALHPKGERLRSSPIAAVVLTGADVDQIAGLLTLRERQAFSLYMSARVAGVLERNPIFNVLAPGVVERRVFALGRAFEAAGLSVTPFAVPGKVALHEEDARKADLGTRPEDTAGLDIACTGSRAVFIPSCAGITSGVKARVDGADLLFFDGTFFTGDEMIRSGEGEKTAQRMGHVPVADSLGAFAEARVAQKFYIHINNTNPIAARDAPERREIERHGWGVAEDGMEFEL